MNEINIFDEITEAIIEFVNALREGLEPALKSIQDMIDGLEPYQRYEFLHPRKKPRGSIRRKRKRKGYTAKEGYEIGETMYKGMMDGFGIEADKGVLEKINEKQDSLKATCKEWDEAIQKDGYVN